IFGNGSGVGARGRDDFDPTRFALRLIDIVEPDAQATDDLESGRRGQQLSVDQGSIANNNRLRLADCIEELPAALEQSRVVDSLEPTDQQRYRRLVHELGNDDSHALTYRQGRSAAARCSEARSTRRGRDLRSRIFDVHQVCMPQRRTVLPSTVRKITFSTT